MGDNPKESLRVAEDYIDLIRKVRGVLNRQEGISPPGGVGELTPFRISLNEQGLLGNQVIRLFAKQGFSTSDLERLLGLLLAEGIAQVNYWVQPNHMVPIVGEDGSVAMTTAEVKLGTDELWVLKFHTKMGSRVSLLVGPDASKWEVLVGGGTSHLNQSYLGSQGYLTSYLSSYSSSQGLTL